MTSVATKEDPHIDRPPAPPSGAGRGRPAVTSHSEIERIAFRLFADAGFEATTLDDIAAAVGIGRRTLTRYYPSKNDIPWGQFDRTVQSFRALLRATPIDVPLWQAVHRGVVAFNDFPADAEPSHEVRMRLLLRTPALQAHAVHRYTAWRDVIAEFVAERTAARPEDLLPRLVGQISLGLALSAYETWLADDSRPITAILDDAMGEFRRYLGAI